MKGNKTKLLRGDGAATEVFTEIASIIEFGDLVKTKEITSSAPTFDSEDGYETASSGAKKVEPIDLKVKYKKDAVIASLINDDFESEDPVNYQIHWPNGVKKQLSLFVNQITIATPQFEDVTESFSFTPSGKAFDVVEEA